MMKPANRAWIGLVFAGALTMQPVSAQNQPQGWPEASGDAAKAVTAAKPAKVAIAPKASPKPKPAVTPARAVTLMATATPAPVEPAVASASEPIAPAKAIATDATATELVTALQQQAELLKRLAAEIEAQRQVMRDQQDKIKALELRATAPAPAAAPAKAVPPPAPITVETGGIKLKVSGLGQGWFTAAKAGAADTFRLRRSELKFRDEMSPRGKWAGVAYRPSFEPGLQMYFIRKTLGGVGAARGVFMTNVQTTR